MHVAAGQKQLEMVEFLIAKGAEINPRDDQGQTPMYSTSNFGINARIKAVLRQHGGVGAFGEPRTVD